MPTTSRWGIFCAAVMDFHSRPSNVSPASPSKGEAHFLERQHSTAINEEIHQRRSTAIYPPYHTGVCDRGLSKRGDYFSSAPEKKHSLCHALTVSIGFSRTVKGDLWSFWPLAVLRSHVGPCFVCPDFEIFVWSGGGACCLIFGAHSISKTQKGVFRFLQGSENWIQDF